MTGRPATLDGFVHAAHGTLVDGSGDELILRGIGLGNWLLPEGYMWKFEAPGPQSPREIEALVEDLVGASRAKEFWARFRDTFIAEDDIARISAEGMNHVRLPINSRVVMDDRGDLLRDGFALIDRLIDWCRMHGLWVVLDLHGAPGGQTGTNIDDSPHGLPELFTDERYRERTIKLWRAIAERYRWEPVVAAYDLLNEPLPNEYQDRYATELVKLYVDLTAAVREVDPNHLITYEGSHWATNWTIFDEVWDQNSMLQFHKYWSPPDRASIQRYIDAGRRLGLPIYMGEGGENNLAWLQTAFQLYEDCGISWNFWPWKKIDTFTSPCSVNAPAGWSDVLGYAKGTAPKPEPAGVWRILSELLGAVPLSRCTYRPEVVSALLRRAPLQIPATGFGFRGKDVSYHASDPEPLRGFRNDDQVTIRHASGAGRADLDFHHPPEAGPAGLERLLVELRAGDWVAYEVEVTSGSCLEILVALDGRSTGQDGEAAIAVSLDGVAAVIEQTSGAVVHAVTPAAVSVGRHEIRVTGRAGRTLVRSIEVVIH